MLGEWENLEKDGSVQVAINDWMQRLTLDALGKVAFDFDFNCLVNVNSSQVNNYNLCMKEAFKQFYFISERLEYLRPKAAWKAQSNLHAFYDEIIEERMANLTEERGTERGDLLSLMIRASMAETEEMRLTKEELRDELNVFFVAGHDTTFNSLLFAFYWLGMHPDIQEKVAEELKRVLGEDEFPLYEQLKELTFMNQFIQEVLRITPPIIITLRTTKEDVELKEYGVTLPKGLMISVNVFGCHHNPKYFKDPEEFVVGREMDGIAFGSGSRACIGQSFSMVEQKVVLASVLQKYKVELLTRKNLRELKIKNGVLLNPQEAIQIKLIRK